jgi:hypothetical protein
VNQEQNSVQPLAEVLTVTVIDPPPASLTDSEPE